MSSTPLVAVPPYTHDNGTSIDIIDAHGNCIATLAGADMAIARLFAAAPDMYQCLYDLLGLMATIDVQGREGSGVRNPALIADLIRGNITEITRVMRAARGGMDEWGNPYPGEDGDA